ncbi:MAG: immunoglobulin domain-containing protein [Verrucomicrobiae bacterium]|nr:immunoglobulin domain-containing protein [Verrucomicrobiae bacterium]
MRTNNLPPDGPTGGPVWRAVLLASLVALTLHSSARGAVVGQWNFENGNLNAAVGGQPLAYADGAGGLTQQGTSFGTTTSLGIPDIGGVAAPVMRFSEFNFPAGYAMPVSADPNGGGSQVNTWTLFLDVLYPQESHNRWRALIDTDGGFFGEDADFFINTANGIGISGNYSGTIQPNTWHRIAIVVDAPNNQIRKYIDGIEVGTQAAGGASAVDGRWALTAGGTATLFADNDGEVAPGFVSSIQLQDVALERGQIAAYGGPSAAGVPTTPPAVPSSLLAWIPRGDLAMPNTDIGIVLERGGGTIDQASIVLRLNGTAVTGPVITPSADRLTVRRSGAGPFAIGSTQTIEVTYNETVGGEVRARSFTHTFGIAVFVEDFDGLELGPNVEEALAGDAVWTKTPPPGWTVDDSGMPGFDEPDYAERNGIDEFSGWTFLDASWWVATAGDQRRSEFTKARGTVAVADPDEWDDGGGGHYQGLFNSLLITPAISLTGVPAGAAVLQFDSSWRPECCDDGPPNFPEGNINNQTAVIRIAFDGGESEEILRWESRPGPFFKADGQFINETVVLPLNNPAGASTMQLTFGLLDAANDWWWAIDNIAIIGTVPAPEIVQHPVGTARIVGSSATFTVGASGAQLSYQWTKDGANIANATNATFTIDAVMLADAGSYRVVVSNPTASLTSEPAVLSVLFPPAEAGTLTQGLVTYLGFEGNLDDASGNNLPGIAVGEVTFAPGRAGQAVRIENSRADGIYNYITLGDNVTLSPGQDSDFTVAFWVKTERLSGDPAIIANKAWASGGNVGWTIGTQGDGRIEWNYARSGNTRKDLDYTAKGNVLNNPDAWSHVVVVWRIDGNAETYLNGELVDVTAIAPGTGDIGNPDLSLNLGQDGTGAYGSGDWTGLLDEVAIWERGLSSEEVVSLYAFGAFGDSIYAPALSSQLATLLKFDGDLADATATGNHGTAVGNPAFAPGRIGQGVHLRTERSAGGNAYNYVTLGSGPNVRFGETQPFTVAFWVKMNEWSSDPSLIANKSWASGGNTGWIVATDSDGRVQWNYRRDGQTRKDFDSVGGLLNDLAWHHVAVVFDINGQAVTYFDGNEIELDRGNAPGRKDITPATGTLFPAGLALNIGQDGTGEYADSSLFDAVLDDVAFWNRSLSGREIALLYVRGLNNQSADGSGGPDAGPTLTAAVSGGQLTLTWTGADFVLEENGVVGTAGGWTPVAGAGANSATVPLTGSARYFRLRK